MNTPTRNFFQRTDLHTNRRLGQRVAGFSSTFFALRSLSDLGLTATPRRYSSSSLPPLFVTGRFAGFSSSAQREPDFGTRLSSPGI